MKYKIVVDKQSRTNPSEEKREYEIDIEELRYKGNICDSLIITNNEDYVIRRLSLSEYGILSVLDEEVKEPLENINIELFEGDNYIYLVDMIGNKFYAEYLIKNDFTDTYITKSEANTAIEQSAKQVEISVNEKLTSYSTTEETNALIQLLSNAITLELEKKINDEDLTGASIALRINDDTSEAQINADKIKLTANDVLEIIAGAILNLTANNMSIKSTNFNVDKDGNLSCANANVQGKIETSTGTVGGWTINDNGLTNGVAFINSKGVSNIYTYADLLIVKGYLMGNVSLTDWAIKHYDLNGDGDITSGDYVTLRNLFNNAGENIEDG